MSAGRRDVVVVGGGPAGSTAAALIAREGHDVLLLDRESFPRYRVGESLMPASYWTLQRLGVLDELGRSAYPRKHSVQFFSDDGRASMPFYFSEVEQHASSVTWQVDRMSFDRMLLDNARASGVEVREQVNVKEVLFDGSRAEGVLAEYADGEREEIRAHVVVDATGQTALIARKLKLKDQDPELRHASFFTRYRGAVRDEGIDEGATLIMRTTADRSWFWYIPLPDDLVSVGVVGPVDHLLKGRGSDPGAVFREEIDRCPALQARIRDAEQVADVRVMRDFSYISHRIAGDGWVMAGDAFGFLDPIYSTGVFLALKSGEFAADAVNDAFAHRDFSAARLGRHGAQYVAAMESLRKLVYAYYDESFNIGDFLKRHPQFRGHVVNLLIGNVFRVPVDALFEAMGRECALPTPRGLASAEEPS
jgi:flavin-dependent dehydrogenase